MFQKIVAIEPLGLNQEACSRLSEMAQKVVYYPDTTQNDQEIARRVGEADCALLSYTSHISASVIRQCPNLKYIGMCCSLYEERSANVDIPAARARGITVTGIRDYGDNGVVEFIVSQLVSLLHGFGPHQWRERPWELEGVPVGIIGLGATGLMTARALRHFGAQVYYNSRTRKPQAEAEGIAYLELEELLQKADIISTHLTKNTIVLHQQEFQRMGNGKILVNTAIGPSFDVPALEQWLQNRGNYYICDPVAMTAPAQCLAQLPNVICANKGSGSSVQTTRRLSQKVIANMEAYLSAEK